MGGFRWGCGLQDIEVFVLSVLGMKASGAQGVPARLT